MLFSLGILTILQHHDQRMPRSPWHGQECQQVASKQSLQVGDRLNFVADQLPMSSFTVDALPQSPG